MMPNNLSALDNNNNNNNNTRADDTNVSKMHPPDK